MALRQFVPWEGPQHVDGMDDGVQGTLGDLQVVRAAVAEPAVEFLEVLLGFFREADCVALHRGQVLRRCLALSRVWRRPSMTSSADR